MAVLDGDHKRRRRLGTALTALKLQDSKGNPNWRLLSVIAILILFMLSIPGSGGEGIALFARRRGPSRVQLKAQRDQLAFCTKILSQSGGAMPFQVQLEWSGDGELQQFDPAAQGIGIQVNPEPGAVLRRVDGLEPLLLPKNNTYSMYVFDRAGNMNSDIVSDSMLINRQWESTEIVAHLNHLQRLHLVSHRDPPCSPLRYPNLRSINYASTLACGYILCISPVPFLTIILSKSVPCIRAAVMLTDGFLCAAQELQVPKHEIFFIDIGANIGAFTMAVAAAGYSVIAIEAMAVNQHALRLSLCTSPALSSLVTVLPVALGKEPATCSLYSAPHNVLDGTIRCEGREFAPGSA